jgi:hypothetical protein
VRKIPQVANLLEIRNLRKTKQTRTIPKDTERCRKTRKVPKLSNGNASIYRLCAMSWRESGVIIFGFLPTPQPPTVSSGVIFR